MDDEDIGDTCERINNNTIYFDGFLKPKITAKLMRLIAEVSEGSEYVIIYFSTYGGVFSCQENLVDYIVSNDFNITFVINHECHSAGTNIILKLLQNCTFTISKYSTFLFHSPLYDSRDRNISRNKVQDNIVELWKKETVKLLNNVKNPPKDIIERIENDEEVYIDGKTFFSFIEVEDGVHSLF